MRRNHEQFTPPSTKEGRVQEQQRLLTELQDLSAQAGKLNESGEEISGLLNGISGLILVVKSESGLGKFLKDEKGFLRKRTEIVKSMEKIKGRLEKKMLKETQKAKDAAEEIKVSETTRAEKKKDSREDRLVQTQLSGVEKIFADVSVKINEKKLAGEALKIKEDCEKDIETLNKLAEEVEYDEFNNLIRVLFPKLKVLEKMVEGKFEPKEEGWRIRPNLDDEDAEFTEIIGEDLELKENEEKYLNAENALAEIIQLADAKKDIRIKPVILGRYKEGLEEMKDLLAQKKYVEFNRLCSQFLDNLKNLRKQIKPTSEYADSTNKAEPTKSGRDANRITGDYAKGILRAAGLREEDLEDNEQEDQEERNRLYEKHKEDFDLLSDILIGRYRKEMTEIEKYLDIADKTTDPEVFAENIKIFDQKFKELLVALSIKEPDIYEIYERDGFFAVPEKEGEWKERRRLWQEAHVKLLKLEGYIKKEIKDEKIKKDLATELESLNQLLINAEKADNVKDFNENLLQFEQLLPVVEAKVKKIESDKEEKKEKTVDRRKLHKESEEKLRILEEKIGKIQPNFDTLKNEIKKIKKDLAQDLNALYEFLRNAEETTDAKEFDHNILEFEKLFVLVNTKVEKLVIEPKADVEKKLACLEVLKDVAENNGYNGSDFIAVINAVKDNFVRAQAYLANGDLENYNKNMEEGNTVMKVWWEDRFPSRIKNEYEARLEGKKTDSMLREEQDRLEEVERYAGIVVWLEQTMDNESKNKFATQIEAAKQFLLEIKANLGDNKIWETNRKRIYDLLGAVADRIGGELKTEYYLRITTAYEIHREKILERTKAKETPEQKTKPEIDADKISKRLEKIWDRAASDEIQDLLNMLADDENIRKYTSEEQDKVDEIFRKRIALGREIRENIGNYSNDDFEKKIEELNKLNQELIKLYKEFINRPKPAEMVDTEEAAAPDLTTAQPVAKKGLFGRIKEGAKKFKDAIFNRETGKVAGKVAYDSVTSILGVKLVTDAVRWVAKGDGDMADWWKGRKETKDVKAAIAEAYEELVQVIDREDASEAEIRKAFADFKAKIEAANISPEAKKGLQKRLQEIYDKYENAGWKAAQERDEDIQRSLNAFVEAKVTGVKIARDFLNFALTATGFSMLRGVAYAGASMVERAGKAKKQYARQNLDADKEKEKAFVRKDVFVNSAIETARALVFQGEQKGSGGVKRTVDFIKALGTVARGLGIYGVAVQGTELPSQSIDRLLSQMEEQGVAGAISGNFIQNVERVVHNAEKLGHIIANPSEIFSGGSETQPNEGVRTEQSGTPSETQNRTEAQTVPIAEAPEVSSVNKFAVEHKLNPESAKALETLVAQHPELNNPESMQRILKASEIGPDVYSQNAITKRTNGIIDTLNESGAERRRVIFEEVLRTGGAEAAAKYLESQNFSSYHLSFLSKYVQAPSHDEYVKFAQQYDQKDTGKVFGLFMAMQTREGTDLANAGMQSSAAKPNVDTHVHVKKGEKINYFGLEGGKPVLSGSGYVTVDQMGVRPENKINISAKDMTFSEKEMNSDIKSEQPGLTSVRDQQLEVVARAEQNMPDAVRANETAQPKTYVEKTIATFKPSQEVVMQNNAVKLESAGNKGPVLGEDTVKPERSVELKQPFAEKSDERGELDKFLENSGIELKDFIKTYDKMVDALTSKLNKDLILKDGPGESHQFLDSKIKSLNEIDVANPDRVQKILNAANQFKGNESGWRKNFSDAAFGPNDKEIDLALNSDRDIRTVPIETNGGHAARIWDPTRKKDIFIYDEKAIFSTDNEGRLNVKHSNGSKKTLTYKQVLSISGKENHS